MKFYKLWDLKVYKVIVSKNIVIDENVMLYRRESSEKSLSNSNLKVTVEVNCGSTLKLIQLIVELDCSNDDLESLVE